MRHQIRGILGLVALATMPACVDLDEELVSGVSSQFYASPQGVEAAVNATYSHLRTVYFSERSVNLSEFGTDLWTNGDQGGNKSFNFYDAGLNPGNGNFSGAWADWYRAINTANSMLDRVSEISGMDPQIRDTRVAVALSQDLHEVSPAGQRVGGRPFSGRLRISAGGRSPHGVRCRADPRDPHGQGRWCPHRRDARQPPYAETANCVAQNSGRKYYQALS